MNNAKILHVLDRLSRGSGVSTVVMNYIQNIQDISMDVAVFMKSDPALVKIVESHGGKVHQLPDVQKTFGINFRNSFRTLLNTQHYTIVHGHLTNSAFLYLRESYRCKVPHRVIHAHSAVAADTFLKHIRNQILECGIPHWANHYMAGSKKSAERLLGHHKDRVFILPNAIDTRRFRYDETMRLKIRGELGISSHELCVGHVGRFVPVKNHNFLLMAFSILHKRNPASRLILRGDGKLEKKIRKIINLLGISGNVIFIKELHNLEHLYSAFDVFWLPSFFEGLPMSGVEAQCSGLPCIFSDTITDEIVLTDHAIQLPISNPSRWVDETLSRFHGFVRTDKSAKVASAGFDIKQQSLKLKKYYENLLQNVDVY